MQTPLPLLQNVKVASPCPAAWSAMESIEGDRVRFCNGCKKNVYNLSAMTQSEAEGLLRAHEGHLCIRYYQRRDGTVLTADCPVGVQAVRQMFLRRSVVTAALFLLGIGAMAMRMRMSDPTMGKPAGIYEATTGAIAEPMPQDTTKMPEPAVDKATTEPQPLTGKVMVGEILSSHYDSDKQGSDAGKKDEADPEQQNDPKKP
ncbi:MAG TPA: hypothetical protein VKU00_19660 [Chthonomonadaceae bacterium]|nr:hypothetical protein [Chthonomonadaceae bacterium]